jgi:uncharacterized protein YndB with AHSA1/START domain
MNSTCTEELCEVSTTVAADAARTMGALTTLEGLRGWWTPDVEGDTAPGNTLTFRFDPIDEEIRMRVDDVTATSVVWTCLGHTSAPAWSGTTVRFEVSPQASGCRLTIRHDGLVGTSVEGGWLHFLASIAAWAMTGRGQPYVACA